MKKFVASMILSAVALPLTFAAQAPATTPAPAKDTPAPAATPKPAKVKKHKKHTKDANPTAKPTTATPSK